MEGIARWLIDWVIDENIGNDDGKLWYWYV
jgi:hypothetical protein